jgi:hypothetical protein
VGCYVDAAMMKNNLKKPSRQLQLSATTVRSLTGRELGGVAGGIHKTDEDPGRTTTTPSSDVYTGC